MEFDLRMAHRWALTLPFLSEIPTHFYLWEGKENFSVLLGLHYFHDVLVNEDCIHFFSLIYRWFLAVDQLRYYIPLRQMKIFYFIFAAYFTVLQAHTGNLYLSLHNIALSESSIQGAFFNQDCDCVLYLLVCSVFIVILAAGINLCRWIWIWGNNKQTDCL